MSPFFDQFRSVVTSILTSSFSRRLVNSAESMVVATFVSDILNLNVFIFNKKINFNQLKFLLFLNDLYLCMIQSQPKKKHLNEIEKEITPEYYTHLRAKEKGKKNV